MKEAIKDKTQMVQKQMDRENGQMSGGQGQYEDEEEGKDSDSDFDCDDDVVLRDLKEQRIKQMKAETNQKMMDIKNGHGKFEEITEEEFLPTVTKSKFIVVHFYHKDFELCKVMDKHLSIISKRHVESKFVKIDAEKCPFFVAKLNIQMLPTVICFMDGVAFDRVVGFEELGGYDDFPTLLLTRKLVKTGCLKALT